MTRWSKAAAALALAVETGRPRVSRCMEVRRPMVACWLRNAVVRNQRASGRRCRAVQERIASATSSKNCNRSEGGNAATKLFANVSNHPTILPGGDVGRGNKSIDLTLKPWASRSIRYSSVVRVVPGVKCPRIDSRARRRTSSRAVTMVAAHCHCHQILRRSALLVLVRPQTPRYDLCGCLNQWSAALEKRHRTRC